MVALHHLHQQRLLAEQQQQQLSRAKGRASDGSGDASGGEPVPLPATYLDAVIDLTPFINTSAFNVPDTHSIERTYILFRTMGYVRQGRCGLFKRPWERTLPISNSLWERSLAYK